MLYIVLKYNNLTKSWETELETYDEADAVRLKKKLEKKGYNVLIDYDNE